MVDTSGLDIPNISQLPGDSSVDQIPLGSQVFPWQDVKPTAQPSRGPAYPDDVLPTTAYVVGNNADQAQRVDTDGAHALKVFVVNESGGGGGGGGLTAETYIHTTNTNSYSAILQNFAQQLDNTSGATYIMGIDLNVAIGAGDFVDVTTDFHWYAWLTASGNINVRQFMVAKGSHSVVNPAPSGDFSAQWNKTIMFPFPINVADTFAGDVALVIRGIGWFFAAGGTIYYV